ncbi:mcfT [Symbiodinium sp. KB8]|nr:mcfT [Symbiodinium sp. KB8]
MASSAQPPLSFSKNLAAGAIAGASELLVMYPLVSRGVAAASPADPRDVIKTRFQLMSGRGKSPSIVDALRALRSEGPSRSPSHAADVARPRGPPWRASYRAFAARAGPSDAHPPSCPALATRPPGADRGLLAPLGVEPLKRAIKFSANAKYAAIIIGDKAPTVWTSLACGALAGVTECLAIAPAEVVKVRMQAKERAALYKNTGDAIMKIVKTEGVGALAQGLEAALWRQATWNGSFFAMSFAMKKHVLWTPDSRGSELGRNFVSGLVGGTVGVALNNPLDVVTSRMRNVLPGEPTPYRNAWQSVALIAREEGAGALYRGFMPKVLRLGPGGGILMMAYEVIANLLR